MTHSKLTYFLLRSFHLRNIIEKDNDMLNSCKCLACVMILIMNKMRVCLLLNGNITVNSIYYHNNHIEIFHNFPLLDNLNHRGGEVGIRTGNVEPLMGLVIML